MGRLDNKVVIITGANSGVGAATAKRFASEGASVVITARRLEPLQAVAEEIKANGGTVLALQQDISVDEDNVRVVEETVKTFGKLDALVNNAGVLEAGLKAIDKFLDADLDRVLEINLKGTMKMTRAAVNKMTTGASVVNVASVAGQFGTGGAAYVASKAGLIGITKEAALRYQNAQIRFNAICPGTIVTPMVADSDPAKLDPDMIGAMYVHNNLKSPVCSPEDIAGILLFLTSDEAKPITGQIIVTDYGSTL